MCAPYIAIVLAALGADTPAAAVALPRPLELTIPLGEALRARSSARSFDPKALVEPAELSTLLWAACGITRPDPSHPQGGRRTSPSAFEAYAIDVFVTSQQGTFIYSPRDHSLVPHPELGKKDLRSEVPRSDWVKEAPILILLVARLDRYPENVRAERRRDYSHADAAVIGENIYLAAAGLRLATVLTADAKPEAGATLGLKDTERVVFILPVGHAKPK